MPLAATSDVRIVTFRPGDGRRGEHLAIIVGQPDASQPVLTRLHSECLTGDLLGSLRCDCGDQLRGAIDALAKHGAGVLLYLAQEGRGIGLVNKLRAYTLQDQGFDTVDANEQLGFDDDERVYQPAARMLRAFGFNKVRLLTNNPAKVGALVRHGIEGHRAGRRTNFRPTNTTGPICRPRPNAPAICFETSRNCRAVGFDDASRNLVIITVHFLSCAPVGIVLC